MPKDLRHFLQACERDHPEDVVTIERPISLKHEIGILIDLLDRQRKFPLLRNQNPTLCNGEPSPYKVIMNEIGSRGKLAYAMNSDWESVSLDWQRIKLHDFVPKDRLAKVPDAFRKPDDDLA